jgi:alcohol dehydrogenase (cytochrome c)
VPKPGDPGSEPGESITTPEDRRRIRRRILRSESKLYIVGTGNPYPIYDPQFRPGDNLYTNSVVALTS